MVRQYTHQFKVFRITVLPFFPFIIYCEFFINQIDEVDEDEDEIQEDIVLCNESNPVWVCKHTMDVRHVCKYLLCRKCFETKLVEDSTQGRNKRTRTKDYDDNDTECNHSSADLQVYNCNGYFSESYIQKKLEEENSNYPTICSGCKKPVRDKYVSKRLVAV